MLQAPRACCCGRQPGRRGAARKSARAAAWLLQSQSLHSPRVSFATARDLQNHWQQQGACPSRGHALREAAVGWHGCCQGYWRAGKWRGRGCVARWHSWPSLQAPWARCCGRQSGGCIALWGALDTEVRLVAGPGVTSDFFMILQGAHKLLPGQRADIGQWEGYLVQHTASRHGYTSNMRNVSCESCIG